MRRSSKVHRNAVIIILFQDLILPVNTDTVAMKIDLLMNECIKNFSFSSCQCLLEIVVQMKPDVEIFYRHFW